MRMESVVIKNQWNGINMTLFITSLGIGNIVFVVIGQSLKETKSRAWNWLISVIDPYQDRQLSTGDNNRGISSFESLISCGGGAKSPILWFFGYYICARVSVVLRRFQRWSINICSRKSLWTRFLVLYSSFVALATQHKKWNNTRQLVSPESIVYLTSNIRKLPQRKYWTSLLGSTWYEPQGTRWS